MALTPNQRIRVLAERLFPKHKAAIGQEEFAVLISNLTAPQWKELQGTLLGGSKLRIGAAISRILDQEAKKLAVAEATRAWADNRLSPAEFDRAFE